jgi:hypothetical protein
MLPGNSLSRMSGYVSSGTMSAVGGAGGSVGSAGGPKSRGTARPGRRSISLKHAFVAIL